MPGGDKTGPLGAGPMTGRGAGICAGYGVPGYRNPGFGRSFGAGRGFNRGFGGGFGGGFGRGRGWRNMYYATGLPGWARGDFYGQVPVAYSQPAVDPESARRNELDFLKAEAKFATKSLEDIKARISELEKDERKK